MIAADRQSKQLFAHKCEKGSCRWKQLRVMLNLKLNLITFTLLFVRVRKQSLQTGIPLFACQQC